MTSDDAQTTSTIGPSGPPPPGAVFSRPLRRPAGQRVLAGVAAGLGDYLNIDPVIVRAVFVGLMIFGGAGLVVYVVGWLLIPAEGSQRSILEGVLGWLAAVPVRAVVLLLAFAVAVYALLPVQEPAYFVPPGIFVNPALLFTLAVVGVAIFVVVRGGRSAGTAAAAQSEPASAGVVASPAVPSTVPAPVAHRRRARGPLGWYIVAAGLIALALLAVVDHTTATTVRPGQFFGAVLAAIGLGLVVGAWWGNARLLILPALLLVPIAVAASFVTVPLEGGIGEREMRPLSPAEVPGDLRLLAGRVVVDLSDIDAADEPIRLSASVAFGEVLVILPAERGVEIRAEAGAGGTRIFDATQAGTSLTERVVRGERSPQFILDLSVGIGQVEVYAGPSSDQRQRESVP